jgi:hypothetical protein
MKRAARQALTTFSDKNMRIDPRFKSRLRSELTAAVQSPQKKSRWHYRLLPAVAVVAIVALASIIIGRLGIVSPNDAKVSALSASELITKARQRFTSFDPRGYAFFSYESERTFGPRAHECGAGTMPNQPRIATELNKAYIYAPQRSSVEAYYTLSSNSYTTTKYEESYYSKTSNQYKKRLTEKIYMPLQHTAYRIDGVKKPGYLLVDKQGNTLPITTGIPKTERNGRTVYAFYFRYDPLIMASMCKDEIISVVFDAETYALLENDTYVGSVHPDNLAVKNHARITYSNIDEATALTIMTAAGFDLQEALVNGRDSD